MRADAVIVGGTFIAVGAEYLILTMIGVADSVSDHSRPTTILTPVLYTIIVSMCKLENTLIPFTATDT